MKFKEYKRKRETEEIATLMAENGMELTPEQIEILLEAGWMSRARKGAGKAALLASMPLMMSANWADYQPKPYHFSGDRIMANQQQMQDEEADKAYINAGGPKFSDRDSESFAKFRSDPRHAEILKRAGLPDSYIPSSVRQFAYGTKITTKEEIRQEEAVIKSEIQKRFGRDSFVEVIQSKDIKTGGAVLLVKAQGIVMAMDEHDAARRAEVIIREMARDKGFKVDEFKDLHKADMKVKPAPRSTVDYTAENAGQPFRFSVQFRIVKR